MDIDFQKYKFYIMLLVVILAYFLIYMVTTRVKQSELTKNITVLNKSSRGIDNYLKESDKLPSDKIIAYHRQKQEILKKNLSQVKQFFQNQEEKLESWFTEKEPDQDNFTPLYEREKSTLVSKYIDKQEGLKISSKQTENSSSGNNFRVVDDLNIDSKAREKDIEKVINIPQKRDILNSTLKQVQKKFWIIKNFLVLLETGKLKVLHKFEFLDKDWNNKTNPNALFDRRRISIEGEIDYEDIPCLVQTILNATNIEPWQQISQEPKEENSENEAESETEEENKNQEDEPGIKFDPTKFNFLTEIKSLSIKRDSTYRPENIVIDVKWNEKEEDARELYYKKHPITLPSVEIKMRIDLFDYDSDQLKNQENDEL